MLKGRGNEFALPFMELVFACEQSIAEQRSTVDAQVRRLLEVRGVLNEGGLDKFGRIEHDNGTGSKMNGAYITTTLAHARYKFEAFRAEVK